VLFLLELFRRYTSFSQVGKDSYRPEAMQFIFEGKEINKGRK